MASPGIPAMRTQFWEIKAQNIVAFSDNDLKLMRFSDRLFIPLFTTDRLMMSAGNLMVKIFFNTSNFCLIADKLKPFEVGVVVKI